MRVRPSFSYRRAKSPFTRQQGERFSLRSLLSNHYVVTAEDLQEVPRATTVLTKMRSLRAQATRASVCGFPAARRRL